MNVTVGPIRVNVLDMWTIECPRYGVKVHKKRHGLLDIMARKLIALGADPNRCIALHNSDGTYSGMSGPIGALAKTRLYERDDRGFCREKYQERDDEE